MKQLLFLALFATAASAQTRGTPTLAMDQSGACRNFSIWDITKPGTDKGVAIGCLDSTTHSWRLAPASVFGDANNTAQLSRSLGPDGLNWTPYGGQFTASYWHFAVPGAHSGSYAAGSFIVNTPGSGTFGPADADVAINGSVVKDNYLTSLIDGEIDVEVLTANQGVKGDVGAYIADVTKTRLGTTDDEGGAGGNEFHTTYVDGTGRVTQRLVNISAFAEARGGISNNTGYGTYNEVRAGSVYSAYHADSLVEDGTTPAPKWKYAFDAAKNRDINSTYFAIRGDDISGPQQPGDILLGNPSSKKILRNLPTGEFQIRDAGDTKTIFKVTDGGTVSFPSAPAWTTYTPSLSCNSGSLGSANATGAYSQLGHTVNIHVSITITTLGTCAISLNFSTPLGINGNASLLGRDGTPGAGKVVLAGGGAGQTIFFTTDYDNGFPFTNSDTINISGSYETP